MKVRDVLSDESKWTQYVNAENAQGQAVHPEHPNAYKWCLTGAIVKVCGDDPINNNGVFGKVGDKIDGSIVEWNDAPERTFEEVRALILELDI